MCVVGFLFCFWVSFFIYSFFFSSKLGLAIAIALSELVAFQETFTRWRNQKVFFFFFGHTVQHTGSQIYNQGSNPSLLQGKHRVLTTGSPEKSCRRYLFIIFRRYFNSEMKFLQWKFRNSTNSKFFPWNDIIKQYRILPRFLGSY